jgi:uncharacterized protein YcfJ
MKRWVMVTGAWLLAGSIQIQAQIMLVEVVQDSDEITQLINKEVPVKSCQQKSIPVYDTASNGDASTADVLAGAIFGGLVGNQVGGGSGKDAATILGAIAGADMINKNKKQQVVTGYKEQEVCDVVYESRSVKEVTGYNTYIKFASNIWQLNTQAPRQKGDYIKIKVSLEAQ